MNLCSRLWSLGVMTYVIIYLLDFVDDDGDNLIGIRITSSLSLECADSW